MRVERVTDEFRLSLAADETAPTLEVRATTEELIVAGDADRLEQVVLNLLSNAVKYSPSGRPIVVRVARDGTQAVLEVADQGIGIPDAAQAHLFKSFYRAGNVGPISGLGIGLHVVATIVQRHGGRIAVYGAEGRGAPPDPPAARRGTGLTGRDAPPALARAAALSAMVLGGCGRPAGRPVRAPPSTPGRAVPAHG